MSEVVSDEISLFLMEMVAPFVIGGLSGMLATSTIQPIDSLKVQIQIASQKLAIKAKSNFKSTKFISILREIKQSQGLTVLYRGLGSAILRQLVYTSVRLGSYNAALDWHKRKNKPVKKLKKILLSMISGVTGAIVGTPFDVVLIRRQASISSGKIPYSSTLDAFKKIVKEQGIRSVWTGINITMIRVILINIGQLASRDIISEELKLYISNETIQNNLSTLLASLLTSFISLPADNIKVKLQKDLKMEKQYLGIMDCLQKSIKRQGVSKLWVGFPIYLLRGAPHSFILIKTQLYLNSLISNTD